MNTIEKLAQDLRSSMSAEQIITDTHQLDNTNIEGLEPRLIVLPETIEQVSRIVALTNSYDLTLLARGGGVRMSLGTMPERFDVLLEMRSLSHLIEHRADDSLCRVEAGMMLSTLQKSLANKGQCLALDPPDAEQTSIGGLLATDVDGPTRLRYGSVHQWVDDIRVVQADGTVVSDKDSIGALGTLGVIVEAQLKLISLPVAQHTLLLTYIQASDAVNTVLALLHSPLLPSAIELIDDGTANDLNTFFGINMPTNGYTLALLVEGELPAIKQQMNNLHDIARTHNAFLTDDFTGERQRNFWDALRNHTEGTVTCKISLPVSETLTYLQQIENTCSRYNLESALVAHAGSGVLYVELRPADAVPRVLDAITALLVHARAAHGTLVLTHCPIDVRRRLSSTYGQASQTLEVVQNEWPYFASINKKRQHVDPKGTFARGRGIS